MRNQETKVTRAAPWTLALLVTALAMPAMCGPAAAEQPPHESPLKLYWKPVEAPFDEYCNEEQRRLDVEETVATLKNSIAAAREQAARIEARIAFLEKNFTPHEEVDKVRRELREMRGREKVAVQALADAVRHGETAPIVDCDEPSLEGKSRPPRWAYAYLPDDFIPANYRPELPPDIPVPFPPDHYCTREAQQADLDHLKEIWNDARERADRRVAIARTFLIQLQDLLDAYRRSGAPEHTRLAGRVEREIADYSGIARLVEDYRNRLERLPTAVGHTRVDPHGDGCHQDEPAATASAPPPQKSKATATPKPKPAASDTKPSPSAKPTNADCEEGGGLMGGVKDVECKIKGVR